MTPRQLLEDVKSLLGQWLEILGGMPFGRMQQIQMLM
ncbi:Uncharacterised protein [Escherichia coli]|nr:hypothetical protein FGAF1055_49310 [Escherichia coli]SRA00292.1 Uncharacterised protein [Escherichia coli]